MQSQLSLVVSGILVALMWAIYPFLLTQVNIGPILTWFWMNAIATAVGAMLCLLTKQNIMRISKIDFSYIIVASLLGPVIGFLLFQYLISSMKGKTSLVITLAFTSPLFAVCIGYIWFHEKLSLQQFGGVLLVTIGIMLLVWKR